MRKSRSVDMATNTVFFCKECGYESSKWLGRCPGCNNWNSFVEEKVNKSKTKSSSSNRSFSNTFNENSKVKKLNEIIVKDTVRIKTGYEELDRVFGGGIVEGSLTLIGGEPGIGKSTLIMQVCNNLSKHGTVLYISGEESEEQVKLRSDRLKVNSDNILFLNISKIHLLFNRDSLLVKKGFLLISHYQNGKGFFIVVRNLDIREKVTLIENYSVSTSNDWK